MKITSLEIANNFILPENKKSFRTDFKDSIKNLIDNNDNSKLNEVSWKIDNLPLKRKKDHLWSMNIWESYDFLKRLEETVKKNNEEIEINTRKLEEYLKVKEINKAIEIHWPEKLYDEYSKEIWKLHAGNDNSWKPIVNAIRDINIVKNNWIKELRDFERFITEVEKRKFDGDKVYFYKKYYIDDFISFIKSHLNEESLINRLEDIDKKYKTNIPEKTRKVKQFLLFNL